MKKSSKERWNKLGRTGLLQFAGSTAIVSAAIATGVLLREYLAPSNVALMLLIAVQLVAIAYGLRAALFACVASALAYNFFFIPPLYMFTIADPANVATLFFFSVAALITGNLTSRLRANAVIARNRMKTTESLYRYSRKLTGVVVADDLLWATAFQMATMLHLRVVILLPQSGTLTLSTGYPPDDAMDESDFAAANRVWCQGTEMGADAVPNRKRLYLPMRTARGVVAVVGLEGESGAPVLSAEQRRLYDALADQAALALERIELARDADLARVEAETEKLRSALLTSISHDLRTPLASILGSATSLKVYGKTLDATAQEQLIETIQEESERLNRFISDLLDMTRLEAGAVEVRTEFVDLSDIVGSALRRAGAFLRNYNIETEIEADLPMVKLDPVLFEQVLFNLLDNAAKYGRPAMTIALRARKDGDAVTLDVRDEGAGIPPSDLERVFDKFYRVRSSDRQRAGTGLGLAICRGFMAAMGGTIAAGNRTDRSGAIFTLRVPLPAPAPVLSGAAP